MPSQNSYVEIPTPSVTVFGDGVSKEIIKRKWGWGQEGKSWSDRITVLIKRDSRDLSSGVTEQRPYEDTMSKQPFTSWEEIPPSETTFLMPGSQISSLQDGDKKHFYGLNHPVYGVLLWQPKQT